MELTNDDPLRAVVSRFSDDRYLNREGSVSSLGNGAMVETQQPAESLNTSNSAEIRFGAATGLDQAVAETLMIPFRVIMGNEIAGSPADRPFTEEDHSVETLVFDRSDKSLGVGILIRRRLQLIRTVRKNVSGLRIHSIRIPDASSPWPLGDRTGLRIASTSKMTKRS